MLAQMDLGSLQIQLFFIFGTLKTDRWMKSFSAEFLSKIDQDDGKVIIKGYVQLNLIMVGKVFCARLEPRTARSVGQD